MSAMKFIFADSQDFIDPGFDFERDEFTANRRVQHDDVYPHEFYPRPPYDGMLVSRAIVGDERWKGKYTTSQSMRFRREGASAFLRYDPARWNGMLIGDCGAFSYVRAEVPPYTVPEMVEYYSSCGFTHGVSIDHVILQYCEELDGPSLFPDAVPPEWMRRFDLTSRLAEEFLDYCGQSGVSFHPIGVAQGWSPKSYSEAVRRLVGMGYDYVALGGMVPLKSAQIRRVLDQVRATVGDSVRLHMFGFTRADDLASFAGYGIESFDSTSPLLRAFKDDKKNYLGSKRWYTAIRVPMADESLPLKKAILSGSKSQCALRDMESAAIAALRGYAMHEHSMDVALEPVVRYGSELGKPVPVDAYRDTLHDRPWEQCPCRACKEAQINVVIFRGANRNRRRGFHNLWEFYRQLCELRGNGDFDS
jgi:hypothetical protein